MSSMNKQKSGCYACGETETRTVFHKGRWTYRACTNCHHGCLDPIPKPGDLAALYGKSYFDGAANGGYPNYDGDAALHRANAEDRLRRLDSRSKSTGKRSGRSILDVGCATGIFLQVAAKAGWAPHGVEISEWAHALAAKRIEAASSGGAIFASMEDAVAAGSEYFDAVTFFQSLEHLPDPRAALAEARELIAPRGTLLIETWNRDSFVARAMRSHWQQLAPPTVVHVFSRSSVTALLEEAGFRNIEIYTSSKRVSIGFVTSILGQKYPRIGKLTAAAATKLHVERQSVRYALGDLITIRARPTSE